MSSRARWLTLGLLAIAPAGALCLAPVSAYAQTPPPAQTATLVVQLPFQGAASPDTLRYVEDTVRNALLARGSQGPDRTTVNSALGAAPPADPSSIVAFGRSMGATHVLTCRVTPLTGQFNLDCTLYDVATQRVARLQRNVGDGTEATVVPEMLTTMFSPTALQPSAEEQARMDAERRRLEEEQRRTEEERRRREADQSAAAQRAREEEARRRAEAERQRLAEIERNRRVYRFAEGGPASIGINGFVGTRLTPAPQRPPGAPPADSLVGGLRIEGAYAALPSLGPVGLEIGATLLVYMNPTTAFGGGIGARLVAPSSGHLPLRGSLGVNLGAFQAVTGARATAFWFSVDARAEYDITPQATAYLGVGFDAIVSGSVPGVPASNSSLGTLFLLGGVRFRFGESPYGPRPAATSQPSRPQDAQPTQSQRPVAPEDDDAGFRTVSQTGDRPSPPPYVPPPASQPNPSDRP